MWESLIQRKLDSLKADFRHRELRIEHEPSFSHNDYLGLASHPRIRQAAIRCLERGQSGSRGSRLLGGHSKDFEQVEAEIARFFNCPSALFFSTGYLANLSAVQALASLSDVIVSDERIHASLIDGIRLSGVEKKIVEHQKWLDWVPQASKKSLLISESLFSMDGDCVDAAALRAAWEKSEGFLLLDEAHAAGVFAESGRGLSEDWRDWSRMAVVVTFGKAFGVSGGAVLCSQPVRDWILNTARSFIYTTAAPPVVPAMVRASMDVLTQEGRERRESLWKRAQNTRAFLRAAGVPIGLENEPWDRFSPIIPVFLPGNDRALRFSETMRNSGFDLRAIRYPTVAPGSERVRISLSLTVSEEQTCRLAEEVVRQWKAFS